MSKFVKDYCYQEIRIEEIEEINQIIEDYNSFYNLPRQGRGDAGDDYAYRRTFFRGQSNSEWKIIPSILRKKDRQDELIIDKETPIFEELAYKQHYKTGTGCLDFTVDINIALFFINVLLLLFLLMHPLEAFQLLRSFLLEDLH